MNKYSNDYFTYKKNKTRTPVVKAQEPASRFKYFIHIFLVSFLVIFLIIVLLIAKITSKMDIEDPRSDMTVSSVETELFEEEQKKIDKRLSLIQQEEHAPSEAKILQSEKKTLEVIDPIHLERNEKIERADKLQREKKINNAVNAIAASAKQEKNTPLLTLKNEILKDDKKDILLPKKEIEQNVTIMSKVLVGRYSTFAEAKEMQTLVKEKYPKGTPFVKKIGDVYSLQTGSYQDFDVAKKVARELKLLGFDVWIYQQ